MSEVLEFAFAIMTAIIRVIGAGRESDGDKVTVAKAILDVFIDTGISAALLSDYLTERGKVAAEAATDIAEDAKLAILGVEKPGDPQP